MKKVRSMILIALIGLFSINLNAQEITGISVPIVTYKITSTGYSHGLTIPNPFYFHVSSLTAEIDSGIGFFLQSYTFNSTDASGLNKISNDSISSNKIYNLTIPEIDTLTLDGMVELKVRQNLIDLYGIENVIKVE